MPALGKRPTLVVSENSELAFVLSESLQYPIPSFKIQTALKDYTFLIQNQIWPVGTRILQFWNSIQGKFTGSPTPVLSLYRDARNGAYPLPVFPIHNALDPTLVYDFREKIFHLFWWWNGWSPDYIVYWTSTGKSTQPSTYSLPRPPENWFDFHSVPDLNTPAWLHSLVPKAAVPLFEPRFPFWVAPIPEGYQYDYFPTDSQYIGESKANGPNRMPLTPGALYLQDLIVRGLVNYPGPPSSDFPSAPSLERDIWERYGGIASAGLHIALASSRDKPEFHSIPGTNPYTNEKEMSDLPGLTIPFVPTTTWHDHLLIINALKAHFDNTNLLNATRILMYATAQQVDNTQLITIPKTFQVPTFQNLPPFNGPFWPSASESVTTSILLADFPIVLAAFNSSTNYRTLVNPDKVAYPPLDYPDVISRFYTDGFLRESSTPNKSQQPSVDWSVGDPNTAYAQAFDVYRNHLDQRSY